MVSNKSEEDSLLLSLESVDYSWVLDSRASFHATPHRGYFLDYVKGEEVSIKRTKRLLVLSETKAEEERLLDLKEQ